MVVQSSVRHARFLPLLGLVAFASCDRAPGTTPAPSDAEPAPPFEIAVGNPYYKVWPAGLPNPRSWGKPLRPFGSTSAAQVDPDGTSIWVFDRCGSNHANCSEALDVDPIMKFDSDGNLLFSFGRGMFFYPHGLHIDAGSNLWATDANGPSPQVIERAPATRNLGHRVIKFTPAGEVLMVIGTAGTAGDPPDRLTAPTGVVTSPSGDIFIAEGHSGANRISHFRADGTFVKSWGTTGSGLGEFRLPHDIGMDSQGRIFVADRTNNRVQIFDQEGNYLDSWLQFGRPSGLYISPDDILYVTDSHSWGDEARSDNTGYRKGVRVGSARTGEVYYYLPDLEVMTRANSGGEGITADVKGNIYVAVVRRLGIEKHTLPEGFRIGDPVPSRRRGAE
jgi:sugar lactone lactonase YvrE